MFHKFVISIYIYIQALNVLTSLKTFFFPPPNVLRV